MKLCKESPIEFLCVDETKLDSSYPDDQFQMITNFYLLEEIDISTEGVDLRI